MVDRRWVQSAGVAGVLFVVLLVLSIVILPTAPTSTDSTAKITSYISSNRGGILAAAVLGAAASAVVL